MSRPVASPQETATRPLPPEPGNPSPFAASLLPPLLVATLMCVYALFFGWLSLERYWAYQMHALDMGNMGQAAWNTAHGHPFRFTNMRLPYYIEAWNTTTRLSFHVEALFPVISLAYLAYPRPESLLVLQTVALTLGAVPVYFLARDALSSAWAGVALVFAYLMFPALQAMNLYEFHPVALATPLLLAAFLFATRRRYGFFALACIAAIGTKEEIGLVVAMFGLWVAVVNRERVIGITTAALGAAWSLFAVLIVERHYRQPGTLSYVHSRYHYLGHGLHGALNTVLHHPTVFADVLFTWPKLAYLEHLLLPVGLLPVFAPLTFLLGAPSFALDLLSTDLHMYTARGDNSAELIAVTVIGGILGARTLLALLGRAVSHSTALSILIAYVLVLSLWSQHVDGFTPLGAAYQRPSLGPHQKLADRFVRMVPASAPVSTQDVLDPHLSSRRYLYLFEDTGRIPPLAPADYILLDVSTPTYPLPSYQLHDEALHFIHRTGWGIAAAQDGLILIEKGTRSKSIPGSFYSFIEADHARPAHPLQGTESNLMLVGFDALQTDLPNHRIPNMAFTVYLRPIRKPSLDVQPVVFEVIGRRVAACATDPLGLAWLPTQRWQARRQYAVHMQPLETQWQSPGTARFYLSLQTFIRDPKVGCDPRWRTRGRLWDLGSLKVQF